MIPEKSSIGVRDLIVIAPLYRTYVPARSLFLMETLAFNIFAHLQVLRTCGEEAC